MGTDKNRLKIKDVPKDFIINCITPYQQDLIELRYYIFVRFEYWKKKGYKKMEIYYKIADEVSLQPDTINKIYNMATRNLILSIKKC